MSVCENCYNEFSICAMVSSSCCATMNSSVAQADVDQIEACVMRKDVKVRCLTNALDKLMYH